MKKDKYNTWIENNKSVNRMLRNLRQSKTGSKRTRDRYITDIYQFCEYHNTTPDKLIERWNEVKYADSYGDVRRIIDEYTEMLREWAEHLEKQKSPTTEKPFAKSSISTKVAGVRSFFRENDLDLKSFSIRPEHVYKDMPITVEQYSEIVKYVKTTQAKAFFKFLEDTGLRPNTIEQLRKRDLVDVRDLLLKKGLMTEELAELLKPYDKIMVVFVDRSKTKRKQFSYFSFIGEETINYLEQYWKEREDRGEEITEDSLIFSHNSNHNDSFRIADVIRYSFNRTVDKLNFTVENSSSKIHRIRMYVGRKLFSSICISSGIPREWRHFFMGQKSKLGIDYNYLLDYIPEGLKQWLKAYPKLKLSSAENIEKVMSLGEQMQRLRQENIAMKSEMEKIRKFGAIMFSEIRKHEDILNAVNLESMKITGDSLNPMMFPMRKNGQSVYIKELSDNS